MSLASAAETIKGRDFKMFWERRGGNLVKKKEAHHGAEIRDGKETTPGHAMITSEVGSTDLPREGDHDRTDRDARSRPVIQHNRGAKGLAVQIHELRANEIEVCHAGIASGITESCGRWDGRTFRDSCKR